MTAAYAAETYIGKSCRKGHPGGVRYKTNYHCIECDREGKKRRHPRERAETLQARKNARATQNAKVRILLASMKHRAKVKNLEFSISKEWVLKRLERGTCELSGLPFVIPLGQGKRVRSPYLPSVDRIDVSQGYTESNCRMILWGLNAAFAAWGEESFAPIAQAWLKRRA